MIIEPDPRARAQKAAQSRRSRVISLAERIHSLGAEAPDLPRHKQPERWRLVAGLMQELFALARALERDDDVLGEEQVDEIRAEQGLPTSEMMLKRIHAAYQMVAAIAREVIEGTTDRGLIAQMEGELAYLQTVPDTFRPTGLPASTR